MPGSSGSTPAPVRAKGRRGGTDPLRDGVSSGRGAFDAGKDAEGCSHNFGRVRVNSRPVGLQAKLWVNSSGDSAEQEADKTADKVMRMADPGSAKACACGGTCASCSAGEDKAEKLQTKSKGVGTHRGERQQVEGSQGPGEIAAPPIVNEVIATPGQAMDSQTRTFFESRMGYDLSQVRIHTDEKAARSAGMVNAMAYTVGRDVVFGPGQYSPSTAGGKRLLAHELTHVMQQRGSSSLQRKEGRGLFGGRALTQKWDIQFHKDKPGPAEMGASPSLVLTTSGMSSLSLVKSAFQMNPSLEAELEGNASIEGPADHNYELSIRRARYIAQLIGIGRVRDVPGGEHVCPKVETGIYACGTTNAKAAVDPADRRVQASLFTPPDEVTPHMPLGGSSGQGPGKDPGNKSPEKKPADKKTEDTKPTQGKPPEGKPADATGGDDYSTQWNLSPAAGYLGHTYLSTQGASDPTNEAIVQLVGGVTRQFHGDNKRGWELQGLVQLQVSLTTGVVSLAGGGQLSYVLPFGNNKWQWSAFAQVLMGSPLSASPSFQFQPTVGSQIMFQPKKWLQLGPQATYGPTLQTNGPQTLDFNGLFVVQFVK